MQAVLTIWSWGSWFLALKRGQRIARHTTLTLAWQWALIAGLAVCSLVTSDLLFKSWPDQTSDYAWFLTVILLLCPPMAVLGARRPGVRVWSLFILIPMVVVLSWPVWTMVVQQSEWRGLSLEMPTVLGCLLVLVMSVGNYCGTRFWVSAVGYFAAVLGILITCMGWNWIPATRIDAVRMGAIMILNFAICWSFISRKEVPARHRVNQIWDDFRDFFGLVWALRMVERINFVAQQEGWTIRMSLDGFPETETGQLVSNETQVISACRWLFRRFVEEEWIGQRLDHAPASPSHTHES